jgi:hypothetical protein
LFGALGRFGLARFLSHIFVPLGTILGLAGGLLVTAFLAHRGRVHCLAGGPLSTTHDLV